MKIKVNSYYLAFLLIGTILFSCGEKKSSTESSNVSDSSEIASDTSVRAESTGNNSVATTTSPYSSIQYDSLKKWLNSWSYRPIFVAPAPPHCPPFSVPAHGFFQVSDDNSRIVFLEDDLSTTPSSTGIYTATLSGTSSGTPSKVTLPYSGEVRFVHFDRSGNFICGLYKASNKEFYVINLNPAGALLGEVGLGPDITNAEVISNPYLDHTNFLVKKKTSGFYDVYRVNLDNQTKTEVALSSSGRQIETWIVDHDQNEVFTGIARDPTDGSIQVYHRTSPTGSFERIARIRE